MDITVAIQTYLRPDFLGEQLQAVEANDPDEIIIGNLYKPELTAEFSNNSKFQEYCSMRLYDDPGLHCKYLLALSAFNDYVLLLDDDVLIGENFLDYVKEEHEDNELWGAMGMDVREDGYYDNYFPRSNRPEEKYETDYLGQAWFGRKEYFRYYWNEPFPVDDVRSGEDMWLSMQARKKGLDIIVPPHVKSKQDTWMSVDNLATGERALHNREDNHRSIRKTIIKQDETLEG